MGENFIIWGKLFGKKPIFQRQILFLVGNFLSWWEILHRCFWGEFYFGGLFSVLSILCMGNLKSLFWGKIFIFFLDRAVNFKIGCIIKHLAADKKINLGAN